MAGVAAYFAKHALGNTELTDLLVELEKTSGRELTQWSKLWLETAGVNTLRPEIDLDTSTPLSDRQMIAGFAVLQSADPEYPTIRPHRLAIGFYNLRDGSLVREHRIEIDIDGERTDVPELVGLERPDLVLVNDDDLAYAKIRLDEASLAVAMEHLADIEDPLARSIVWGAAWDATRDAEASPSDYVQLVLNNIASETESTTVRTTLSQLTTVARYYVAPERRAATIAAVGDGLWMLAQAAPAGSDSQFQFVKFFANIASTAEHTATLQGLLDGSISLDGLEVDTDLRWEIVEGLVLVGALDGAAVDAELAADNTSNGAQAAARARASIPTAEGKRAAFDSLVDSDDLPNAIVRMATMGYQHVNDPASLEGLVEPYFAALNEIWATRSYKIAEYIILGLYPAPLASQALVDATKAWLNANPDVPALRRMVIENLAGVERALKAQERDGA
jgi:aminopeptidase N